MADNNANVFGGLKSIRAYFGLGANARPVDMKEIRALSSEDRKELGEPCQQRLRELGFLNGNNERVPERADELANEPLPV